MKKDPLFRLKVIYFKAQGVGTYDLPVPPVAPPGSGKVWVVGKAVKSAPTSKVGSRQNRGLIALRHARYSKVKEIMSHHAQVAQMTQHAMDPVPLFSQGGHHIPIVDEQDRLVGVITRPISCGGRDLAKVFYLDKARAEQACCRCETVYQSRLC